MARCRVLLVLLLGPWLLAPLGARQPSAYRILVTNDDGVRAPGLATLAQTLRALGNVAIVAPSDNQSGKSQSLNTREPIFREDLTLPNGMPAIGLTATPATTVQVGLKNILRPKPDLVVSGINPEYNLGYSAYLSGTVGAARQAAMDGVPAIAASLGSAGAPRDFAAAAEAVLIVARLVKDRTLPPFTFLNINVPPLPAGGYKGYRITTPAPMRGGVETFAETTHPAGRTLYWSVYKEGATASEGTDAWAVEHGYVAITPMHLGEQDSGLSETVRTWFR